MENKLYLTSSPHIRSSRTTRSIMLDVIFSLLPATAAGILFFGWRAALLVAVCIATAVLGEGLFNLIVQKEQTVNDLSAVVTGLLLGLNLPANLPVWQAVVGTLFAILIVKCFFGGLGCNVVNPAITGRVFMLAAFGSMAKGAFPLDSVATATPLAMLKEGSAPAMVDLITGNVGGAIGETSVIALTIGFVYLLVRRVISWHLPVAFIGTVYLFTFAVTGDAMLALTYVFAGGLFLGAIFMATDYVTSPSTPAGKLIFGLGAGIITVLIRLWGNYPEGVSYGILLMNILNPYIEGWTKRKVFGGASK